MPFRRMREWNWFAARPEKEEKRGAFISVVSPEEEAMAMVLA